MFFRYVSVTLCTTSQITFSVITSFSVSQSVQDKRILQLLLDYFGCTSITTPRLINSRKLMQEFRVVCINYCVHHILPLFNSISLLTHKSHDYSIFREIVPICVQNDHLTLSGLERIRKLKQTMRQYSSM